MIDTLAALAGNLTSSGGTHLLTAASTMSGLNPLIAGGGSAIVGYIAGFALKKIIKWLLIGLGVLAGLIFLAVQWMSNNGYIQGVKWDKLGNDISSYGQHLATQVDFTNLHGLFHYLGIPMTSGLAVGALAGFIRTR